MGTSDHQAGNAGDLNAVTPIMSALLLGLLLVVAATVGCVSDGREAAQQRNAAPAQTAQPPKLEIPDAAWEPAFFEDLETRTTAVNLPQLRTVVLPESDLEVRFWYEGMEIIHGVVIRRMGQQWSANWIYQTVDSKPSSAKMVLLDPPKSGWDVVWNKLVDAAILTLPDSPQPRCSSEALDGIGYIVETNVNRTYRTYMYSNPQLMKCPEAKQILQIERTLGEEFSLHRLR